MSAALFIVKTLFDLYIITFLLRFAMQWVRADFRNPLSQFIMRVTNPIVVPLRRIVPSWGGLDLATLVAGVLLELLATLVILWMTPGGFPSIGPLLYWVLLRLIVTTLRLYFFLILVYVILSWVSPGAYSPVTQVLASLTEPVLRPVRRIVPPIGGIDLSPLFVLIGLQALIMLIPLPFTLA
ncbi:MAG: YggT family protein [Gammaproteobacteria bacterium]